MKCDVLFGSPFAFDKHLKRKGPGGPARHDYSGMPVNRKGYLVTELYEKPGKV